MALRISGDIDEVITEHSPFMPYNKVIITGNNLGVRDAGLSERSLLRGFIESIGDTGLTPKRVIINKPAVIIYWLDGSKTVVKKQKGDKWDPEKGVAMAICKRLYGNTGRYNDVIKRALEGGAR